MKLQRIIQLLKIGKVGVIPTDTIYGIVGSALSPKTVEEIYRLRKRVTDKPMIILISSLGDLKKFNIKLTQKQKKFLEKNWPNPVSVALSCKSEKFKYLHRGTYTLAFRMPKDKMLLEILSQVGPLVAPSANTEGAKPSENIDQAKQYFDGCIAFFVDGGQIKSKPSTIVQLNDFGQATVLRNGRGRL